MSNEAENTTRRNTIREEVMRAIALRAVDQALESYEGQSPQEKEDIERAFATKQWVLASLSSDSFSFDMEGSLAASHYQAEAAQQAQLLQEAEAEIDRLRGLVDSAVAIGLSSENARIQLETELTSAKKVVIDLTNAVKGLLDIK